VVGVYTSTSDRDTKTASAGVEEGMFAFTKDTDKFWYYNGSSWTQMTYPTVTSGTTVPADATGANGDVFLKIS